LKRRPAGDGPPLDATGRPDIGPSEPFAIRWKRRAVTIPAMLGVTAAAIVLLPLLAIGAAAYDIARLRLRLPTLRFLLFVIQYLVNDSLEILVAPLYWALAGFGTRLDSPASLRRHERLQQWSIEVLARRAERLLGVNIDIDADSAAALERGPLIVCCRHVNLLDASLPSLLLQRQGFHVRGVIMAEMLADPGFDLLYGRLGSVFIARDQGPQAQQAIARLAAGLTGQSAVVIFPEGRLFRPELLTRALARLAAGAPERADRLDGLRHILPPRPGGLNALLDALPKADVVFIAHTGLDDYPRFADLARAVPLRHPIRVAVWRITGSDIPTLTAERTMWLDTHWRRVDDWVHANAEG
jgi:1-acyl-sn-glycerol-3-phosphate acyltransferase